MKMGYVQGTGLGENGQGIVEPIMPSIYKRGEGIKVNGTEKENMMQSRVVDDWGSGSESENDSDSETMDNEKLKVPLGFQKSGLYKSEYEMPELSDLVRRLREYDVEVPYELIEWIESMDPDDVNSPVDLQLRKTLWDILKKVQADIPKIKYLNFEISNIEQFNEKCKLDLDVLHQCYMDISSKNIRLDYDSTVVKDILDIKKIEETSTEVKFAILKLLASKIAKWWEKQVMKCDFQDIARFGELLDYASAYIELSDKIGVDKTVMREDVDDDGARAVTVEFSIVGSVILKPLLLKLSEFYGEWDIEKVHLGVGVFEELRESELLPADIFDFVIFEKMIIPQLLKTIEAWDLTNLSQDDVKSMSGSIIEWLKMYPEKCDVINQQVVNKYCRWILGYRGEDGLSYLDLKNLGLYYWLDVFQDEKYNVQVNKVLLGYCVRELRKGGFLLNIEKWLHPSEEKYGRRFFSGEIVSKIVLFVRRLINLRLDEYSDVIYNEIVLPLWAAYLALFLGGDDDREEYLRRFVRTCSVLGVLDDDRGGFSCVVDGLRECYELENNHLGGKIDELADACECREEDWKALVSVAKKKRVVDGEQAGAVGSRFADGGFRAEKEPGTAEVRTSLKEIVFEKLDAAGIAIVPCGERHGKQLYAVGGGRRRVYFENKVVYGEDGFPLTLAEVMGTGDEKESVSGTGG